MPIAPIVPRAIVPSVPSVLGASTPLIPPAFLEDEGGGGSEWGWSDWDAPDAWDYGELFQ